MPSLFRPWSLAFAAVAFAIVSCLMLPGYFGLMKFTQWGAMYTDSWCRVEVYSGDPSDENAATQSVTASTYGPGAVFSAPMHNHFSCAMWARTIQCGRTMSDGWTVVWARPVYKGNFFLDPNNACDMPLDPNAEWFRNKE